MPEDSQDRIVNVIAGSGWDDIRLGDSEEQVRQSLENANIGFSEEYDPFCWELDDPSCTLQFLAGKPKQLVQIVFNTELAHYHGRSLIGLPLAEALLALDVRSFEDTLWSAVDIDSEYSQGIPLDHSKRPRTCEPQTLVDGSTLWIKSLGLGLVTNLGSIVHLVVRRPADVPTVGCGPATEATILAAGQVDSVRSAAAANSAPKAASWGTLRLLPWMTRLILALLALVLFVTPIYIVVNDIRSWQKAKEVVGVVVETNPPGPFPDEAVIEYKLPDESLHRVTIKTSYTTAREVGEKVDLIYRPDKPAQAMTRIQSRDQGLSVSPYWLFGSVAAATFCLAAAFPGNITIKKRRFE